MKTFIETTFCSRVDYAAWVAAGADDAELTAVVDDIGIVQDSVLGTLLGAAVGDALGVRTEFLTKAEARAACSTGLLELVGWPRADGKGHWTSWAEGDWTDDTDQQVLLMLSLTQTKGIPDPVDYGKRLGQWETTGLGFAPFNDTASHGCGNTTRMVLTHPLLTSCNRPDLAAVFVWSHEYFCEAAGRQPCDLASNGCVMRCAVSGAVGVGAGVACNLGEVAKNAVAMARITHADPRCAAGVAFVTTLVHQLIRWRVAHAHTHAAPAITKPSSDAVEAMIAASLAVAISTMADELQCCAERVAEVVATLPEKMAAPAAPYLPDQRAQGPQIEAGWTAANTAAVRAARWSSGELERYVAATTIEELNLSGEGDGFRGNGIGYAFIPVGCAVVSLRALCRSAGPVDYHEAIHLIMSEGGDADTNATVAGAVLGAAVGASGLPKHLVEQLKYREWLTDRTTEFVQAACLGGAPAVEGGVGGGH